MDFSEGGMDDSASEASSIYDYAAPMKISSRQWVQRLASIEISKKTMDKLVLNYLIFEGLKEAAERFQEERGLQMDGSFQFMAERIEIVRLIREGRIMEAIDHINQLDSTILDGDPAIAFQLQSQQFIEMIRSGDIQGALSFAQKNLAPRTARNPQFMSEMEQIMSLFAFDNPSESPLASLMSLSHRAQVASTVNAAILACSEPEKDPRIVGLLRRLSWAEERLSNIVSFPRYADLNKLDERDSSAMDQDES
ncbi:CTLH domain-containing protein [Plasmodiophora brassicae]|uniref:CTLH domain-containing protein n=1 Tax=Plasmodiophora brassicae TaxID=37360 RepID=A0A0G4ILV0_PLABS|nr:hypothetical protein PBRA_004814 [Plasmodiophora brassicae]SPQ93332.1 unnamed protein product [Plasmodiophora brassicae]